MAKHPRSQAGAETVFLETAGAACWECGGSLWVISHKHRTVVTLRGLRHLVLKVRRCRNGDCPRFRQLIRPEGEGAWALPHSEVGLDVIARVGTLRFAEHRSVPEIHRDLAAAGVRVAERTVTNLLARYAELLTVHLRDPEARRARLQPQGKAILAGCDSHFG